MDGAIHLLNNWGQAFSKKNTGDLGRYFVLYAARIIYIAVLSVLMFHQFFVCACARECLLSL